MYLFDFADKLKRINPRLYVDTRQVRQSSREFNVTGIYYKQPKKNKINIAKSDMAYAGSDASKYLLDIEAGSRDKYIAGVALEWVPEYDWFEYDEIRDEMNLVAPGWRRIITKLLAQNLINLGRARWIFKCSSLGESDYDKMNFKQRQLLAMQERANGDRHSLRVQR